MKNMTTRLAIVAILVVLLSTLSYVMPKWLQAKDIRLPEWDLHEIPLEFESWQRAEVKLDPKIKEKILIDADIIADRAYRDEESHVVSLHVALFRDLDAGVFHSPINCYRGGGWKEFDRTSLSLRVSDKTSIPVNLSTWEQGGEKIFVMYWYQLDEHILFSRWDLPWTRWKMRGKKTWPALVKVLLQTRAADPEGAKERIQTVARFAYQWLNQPGRQPSSGGTASSILPGEIDGPGRVFDKAANSDYNTGSGKR